MMIAFKILMFLCAVLSFLGSIAEKEQKAKNTDTALFAISGGLLLLAIVATNVM